MQPNVTMPFMMRGKKAYYPDITGWFYQVLSTTERTESSREQEPVPSTSGVIEITACPLHPIADGPSALPSSIVSLLPVHSLPAFVYQLLNCTIVLFKILSCKTENVFSMFVFAFSVLFL